MTTQEEEGATYIKNKLIQEAQSIAFSGDLRTGHDRIQSLREQWKQAGRVGRDADGNDHEAVLWQRFKSACDDFYKRRSDARDSAIAEKKHLVYEMQKLSGRVLDKSAGEAANALMARWKAAARGPKANEEQLWYEFSKAKKQVDDELRRLREANQQNYADQLRERISKAESARSNYQSRIYEENLNWQYSDFKEPSYNHPHYSDIMTRRRERERRHYDKVSGWQDKVDSISASISDLERRLRGIR
ncbi:DUF349 domain-containing protein [Arthrobacter sp. KNU40]|uniref:DUF349 domain-containing protein n=1 Tax=Arthrobacter sp. KNU40 TaxID=3447965 RepID=UPI003F60337F